MNFLSDFFDTEGFMPHGMCLLWKPEVFWLHVVSDGVIALAYYSIPFALIYFVQRRRDLAFPWIFQMFGLFILACGTTHLFGIWTMWNPDYGVDGLVKALTALVSIVTAVLLWPLMPKALALPSAAQLEQQVHEREQAEAALQRLNAELENRVRDRTAQLLETNRRLEAEIAERRQAEERLRTSEAQLVQAQKMEAVGKLTGGLAHDFNNLLAVIIGNLDLLEARVASNPEQHKLVERALKAGTSGSELTRKLLAFARKQQLQRIPVDLNAVAAGTVNLLRRTLGEDVVFTLKAHQGLWPVETDPVQVEAALTNLAINARDAMPDGGVITIETANVHLDDGHAARDPDVPPGDYAMLAVTDTGGGIPPEDLPRVFEPFFTTKEKGVGSGLGLSIVYGFVKQCEGHVRIESAVGRGTTVRVYFPRSKKTPETPEAPPAESLEGGSEHILVVEDNDDVRQMVVLQLTELGYHTLEAGGAAAALAILNGKARIDLLFTDIIMPGMTGTDLAAEAVKIRPGLPVLLTSGYTESSGKQGWYTGGFKHLLTKPYRKPDLARKIREVLREAAKKA